MRQTSQALVDVRHGRAALGVHLPTPAQQLLDLLGPVTRNVRPKLVEDHPVREGRVIHRLCLELNCAGVRKLPREYFPQENSKHEDVTLCRVAAVA